MLERFTDNVWLATQPLRMLGIELGARMTVIRLADGGLWVHSPIALVSDLEVAVRVLGPVRYLVAPNRWHHLFIAAWSQAFPDARVLGSPGLREKRPDLAFDVLTSADDASFRDEIAVLRVAGVPMYDELVFFHAASKTLVLTDIAVHIDARAAAGTRWLFRCLGGYNRLGWSPLERLAFIRDRAAFVASLHAIATWPFERIVLAHGTPIEDDARQRFHAYIARC